MKNIFYGVLMSFLLGLTAVSCADFKCVSRNSGASFCSFAGGMGIGLSVGPAIIDGCHEAVGLKNTAIGLTFSALGYYLASDEYKKKYILGTAGVAALSFVGYAAATYVINSNFP